MATFNYTVDTIPMAEEINSVSKHVGVTTLAVIAMQNAVVLAEEKAAEHVCENVNKGFFTLIHSQISQKMAKLKSEVDSYLMQLNYQRKQLLAIKGRMERDYNMISNRYFKLFTSINQNLKQRIFALDKPIIDFAVFDIEKVFNRTKILSATVPIAQNESLTLCQKIIASNVKFKGFKVIGSMTNFLSNMFEQKKLTDSILLSSIHVKNASFFIPVILSEVNIDKLNNKSFEYIVCKEQLNSTTQSFIKNTLNDKYDDQKWVSQKEINLYVKSEFNKFLSIYNSNQRVKDMTNKLFLLNNFHILISN